MDYRYQTMPGRDNEEAADYDRAPGNGAQSGSGDTDNLLGQELASFAFLREDDEREVRLYFRDMPANEIALLFQRAGAIFVSMTGERAHPMQPINPEPARPEAEDEDGSDPTPQPRRKKKRRQQASAGDRTRPLGELTVRYFFSTETLVYTVIITSSTSIMQSIESIYPSARLLERELEARLATSFRMR
jgi:hypothetical protein